MKIIPKPRMHQIRTPVSNRPGGPRASSSLVAHGVEPTQLCLAETKLQVLVAKAGTFGVDRHLA